MAKAAGSLIRAARAQRATPEGQPALGGQGHPGDQQPDHQGVVVARGDEAEQGERAQRRRATGRGRDRCPAAVRGGAGTP